MPPKLGSWKREPREVHESHWTWEGKGRAGLAPSGASSVDLRPFSASRQDQSSTNACVCSALVKAFEIERCVKYGLPAHVDLSRRFPYWMCLDRMYRPPLAKRDEGTWMWMACDELRKVGCPAETDWPWEPEGVFERPTWHARREAWPHRHQLEAWERIKSSGSARVAEVIRALSEKKPVAFGTELGANWFDYQAGDVLSPLRAAETPAGGHAMAVVGWLADVHGGVFLVENSWGENWGEGGFCYVSPELVASPQSGDYTVVYGAWE